MKLCYITCCLPQDLALDIPDAAHQLSLFLGRIIVDEALPPSFLASVLASLRNDSLGVSVVQATGASPSLVCPSKVRSLKREQACTLTSKGSGSGAGPACPGAQTARGCAAQAWR